MWWGERWGVEQTIDTKNKQLSKVNKRWINSKGDGLTIVNAKMIMVLKVSYVNHYAKVKHLQNKDRLVDITFSICLDEKNS